MRVGRCWADPGGNVSMVGWCTLYTRNKRVFLCVMLVGLAAWGDVGLLGRCGRTSHMVTGSLKMTCGLSPVTAYKRPRHCVPYPLSQCQDHLASLIALPILPLICLCLNSAAGLAAASSGTESMIKLFSVKVMPRAAEPGNLSMHEESFCTHQFCCCCALPASTCCQLCCGVLAVQDKQKKDAAAAAAGKPKQSAGELRLNKGTAPDPTCHAQQQQRHAPFSTSAQQQLTCWKWLPVCQHSCLPASATLSALLWCVYSALCRLDGAVAAQQHPHQLPRGQGEADAL